jgi:hypothetical protein
VVHSQLAVVLGQQSETLTTNDGMQLFADELRFPDRVVEDAARFDGLVSELADVAARPNRPATPPSLAAVFRRYSIREDEQPVISATFATMCRLHDEGRNHIWGYYVRNLARPLWLTRPANRVDVLVGNPPWLSYRFMPPSMKDTFRVMSTERRFWAGAAVATHQDLSALFVARAAEQYLNPGGRLAFVMPLAVLSRRQFAGFRTGRWGAANVATVNVTFDAAWDLHAVKPSFFPVPAAVVFGRRTDEPAALTGATEVWSGRLRGTGLDLAAASTMITRRPADARAGSTARSPYAARFSQGATLVPRFLLFVEDARSNPLGAGAGRRAVRSRRTNSEKRPWKTLPGLTGTVERQFIRSTLVGDSVLPFRLRTAAEAIIPWDGTSLEATAGDRLDLYPGLAAWWREATEVWEANKSAESNLSLLDRLDYQRGLRNQLPGPAIRVVYTKGGMYLAAAVVTDVAAVVDHKLYWAAAENLDEARYITAVLNSSTLLRLIQPLQARGEHNPRDFDKYVWQAPIPSYDASRPDHHALVQLAAEAESHIATLELPTQSFQALRRRVRRELDASGIAARLDAVVQRVLNA